MAEPDKLKVKIFRELWDKEFIEIQHHGLEGDFYPNERGLVVCRKQLRENPLIESLVVDGDFDLRNNFEDEFYGFAHLLWKDGSWILWSFNYDKRVSPQNGP